MNTFSDQVLYVVFMCIIYGCIIVSVVVPTCGAALGVWLGYLWFTRPRSTNECPRCRKNLSPKGKTHKFGVTARIGYCRHCHCTYKKVVRSDDPPETGLLGPRWRQCDLKDKSWSRRLNSVAFLFDKCIGYDFITTERILTMNELYTLVGYLASFVVICIAAALYNTISKEKGQKSPKDCKTVKCPCCRERLMVKSLPLTIESNGSRITQKIWCRSRCNQRWHRHCIYTPGTDEWSYGCWVAGHSCWNIACFNFFIFYFF